MKRHYPGKIPLRDSACRGQCSVQRIDPEQEREGGRNRREIIFSVIVSLNLFTASLLFVFPSVGEAIAVMRQSELMLSYDSSYSQFSEEEAGKILFEAEAYNRRIAEEQEVCAFTYRGEESEDEVYESVLNISDGGIMCDLEIPDINVRLPVAHGTSEEVLMYECGHIRGSSLPVGGESTHAVIAAHTGLVTAELFTRLTELSEGSLFYIRMLGKVHTYRVCRILTVSSGEEFEWLQVEKGKDLVTLYTCTPCGINDHRLLVTGERIFPDPGAENDEAGTAAERKKEAGKRLFLFILIPVCIFLLGIRRTTQLIGPAMKDRHKLSTEKGW